MIEERKEKISKLSSKRQEWWLWKSELGKEDGCEKKNGWFSSQYINREWSTEKVSQSVIL